jgi:protoporphyrinogen oxidase
VIIGAGPGGLTAAYELVTRGYAPVVLEKARLVGGIARTETFRGYRFDIGGHRFFTKVPVVQELWEKMLGTDFIRVPRLTHIYYQRRFLNYPLEFLNAFSQVGPVESARILSSYVKAKLSPSPEEKTFEQWVSNRFGRRLFEIFFKTYTEKVWGLPCNQIQAEWAAQRIKSLSLTSAVTDAIFRNNNGKHHSLISEFSYPVGGPGMMWKRFQDVVQAGGGSVHLNVEVVKLRREGQRIRSVIVRQGGEMTEIAGGNFLSTMPLCELIARIDPPPPPEVIRAARQLTYRAFLLVGLILNRAELFPDNWIYVHSPEVMVGRIQNFKNWSATMVPDPRKTSLGMEYFCNEQDPIWSWSDESLHEMAVREIIKVGLANPGDVEDSVVIRQPRAYPVYANGYHEHIEVIRRFLYSLENLQTFGRNGMHRYNNQDHSMLSGMLAVRNLLGETHDLWGVNTDRSYQEELRYPNSA